METAKVQNITGKTESKINMWTSTDKVKFKTLSLRADEKLTVVELSDNLTNGHYAISWGALSSVNPLEASATNNLVYDFEYINPKAFVELRETALYLTEFIQHQFWKADALQRIASEFAKTGDHKRARNLFSQAIQSAQTQNGVARQEIFAHISIGLGTVGYIDSAMEILQSIKFDGATKFHVLRAIAIGLAETGEYDQAIQIAQTIEDDKIKAYALDTINHKWTLQVAEPAKVESCKVWAEYLAVIDPELAKTGKYDRALQVVMTTKNIIDKDDVLKELTRELARTHNYSKEEEKQIAGNLMRYVLKNQ